MQQDFVGHGRCIEININTIENVVRKEDINVYFQAEHNGVDLGKSSSIKIESTCEKESYFQAVNHIFYLAVSEDNDSLDAIASTPVLIKAIYITEKEQDEPPATTKKKSIFSATSSTYSTEKILGICNLDLISIILGEERLTEKLILEEPTFSFDGTLVSWENLPRITVTTSRNRALPFQTREGVNFFYVTVESVYNPPDSFEEDLEYKAGTVVYSNSEIPDNIIFDNGTWIKLRDIERTKRWNTLPDLENRARLSKYKLDYDFTTTRNKFRNEIDLARKVCEDTPRIEWNAVHRRVIWKDGMEAMQNHIARYKHWPFQFMLQERDNETKTKNSPSRQAQLYQCYADLSELLFPGKRSTRVVAQLYTYSPTDITEKVDLENNIFVLDSPVKEQKDKDKKQRPSKVEMNQVQLTQSDTEVSMSFALLSEDGEPTVIVIEVELQEPLIPCRILQDYTNLIGEMIPKIGKKPRHVYSSDVAEEQYASCIQKLSEVITESYRDYCEKYKTKSKATSNTAESRSDEKVHAKYCHASDSDELTCFTQYLYRTGVYLSLRSTLRTKVTMLLDQKFKMPSSFVDSEKSQNFIASVYTYLVEQMHTAINQIVEGRIARDLPVVVDPPSLYFYAEEAYELGDYDVAKRFYTKVINSKKNEPEPWVRYAVFLKKIGHVKRAVECCLEAIALNRQYVIALLIYAGILFENREYKQAEIFLKAIVEFYPRFLEGWTTLHLFYIRTEYYPGIDLSLRIAEKCMEDKNREVTFEDEPLAWSTIHCPRDNVYIVTAVFLLKFHLCEFAEIALAQEMSNSNKSTHFLYYMAVEHSLTERFEDAISHLEEARCNYGMDYTISSLIGHCYFKLGDFKKAQKNYEFAHMLFNRPDDLHLVQVRLGYYYYNTGDYERAKIIFLSTCKTSPTSQTWLGAGISFYELSAFHEAETALSEANRIDNCNPETWGYLCLLNMTLQRYDEFSQCYSEMIQNNLKNIKLWLRITNMMESLNYAPPIETDDLTEEYSKEDSEEQFENW